MKFEKLLAQQAPALCIDNEFSKAVVRYKLLKKFISKMTPIPTQGVDPSDQQCEECCICLEAASRSKCITTRCHHNFHAVCLVKSLGGGSCNSCPLCRCKPSELVPEGGDGDCLRFLAMVYVSMKAVQTCHDSFMRALEHRLETFETETGFQRLSTMGNRELEIETQIVLLHKLIDYDRLNCEGFRKIMKKFDKHTGFSTSTEMLAWMHSRAFYIDSHSADGRCARALARLEAVRARPQDSICYPVLQMPTFGMIRELCHWHTAH